MSEYKPQYDLFCPICSHSIGVRGEKTEGFSQYVAWCKNCRCEFVVNYFKVVKYTKPMIERRIQNDDI